MSERLYGVNPAACAMNPKVAPTTDREGRMIGGPAAT